MAMKDCLPVPAGSPASSISWMVDLLRLQRAKKKKALAETLREEKRLRLSKTQRQKFLKQLRKDKNFFNSGLPRANELRNKSNG